MREGRKAVGIEADEFRLRVDLGETYLSGAYLEYFSGDMRGRILGAIHAIRSSGRNVRPRDIITCINVGEGRAITSERRLRFRHEPKKDNPAYAALHGLWPEDGVMCELLARLASKTLFQVDALENLT
ncbi:MAG: hypothetical protein IID54_07170 [Proteobacteria bacterium]|nr:hypothetical protein [Pseudomonadota bacterium]